MTERPDDRDPYAEDVIAGRAPGTPFLRGQRAAVGAVALGGALGAEARYVVGVLLPAAPGTFPTGTVAINVVGCLLMGVLVVLITEAGTAHPLWRPFLGVGVLGGFTTFSTFAVDGQQLLTGGHLALAAGAIAGTAAAAVGAAWLGLVVTRRLIGSRS